MDTLEIKFEELKKSIHKSKLEVTCNHAGKNQKKFINLVNIGLFENESAFNKAYSSEFKNDYTFFNCLNRACNNPASILYGDGEDKSDEIILKGLSGELLRSVWWFLAHELNTDKARSLPHNLEYHFYL